MRESEGGPAPVPGRLERFVTVPALLPACRQLEGLGREWARTRGTEWDDVLNGGPLPATGPSWRFRWCVVAEALSWAAGLGPPPAQLSALPLGLQAFLAWALPASLHPADPVALDPHGARRALEEAERLIAEMAPPGPASPSRPAPRAVPAAADASALLAAALEARVPVTAVPGVEDLRAALAAGPVPLALLRALAARHGLLPGTLLDALDRLALRETGRPAARVEGERLVPEGGHGEGAGGG